MHSHDYVELLIRQTLTPQGKSLTDRPVFHIIVQGTYNPACGFHRTGLSTAAAVRLLVVCVRLGVSRLIRLADGFWLYGRYPRAAGWREDYLSAVSYTHLRAHETR